MIFDGMSDDPYSVSDSWEKKAQALQIKLDTAEKALTRYRSILDSLYNRSQENRDLIVKEFGTLHVFPGQLVGNKNEQTP